MRFTAAVVAALALAVSASPLAPAPASDDLEKRTGGNGVACIAFCWEFCVVPTACGLCISACMAVANPITEFDPTKVPGLVTPSSK